MNACVKTTEVMNISELVASAIRKAKAPLIALLNHNHFSAFSSTDVLDFAVIGAEQRLKNVLDLYEQEPSPITVSYDHGVIEHIRIAWAELMLLTGAREVFDGLDDQDRYIADVLSAVLDDLDVATSSLALISGAGDD